MNPGARGRYCNEAHWRFASFSLVAIANLLNILATPFTDFVAVSLARIELRCKRTHLGLLSQRSCCIAVSCLYRCALSTRTSREASEAASAFRRGRP